MDNMASTWECLGGDSWGPSGTCEICFHEYTQAIPSDKWVTKFAVCWLEFTLFAHSITMPYSLRKVFPESLHASK